MYASILPRRWKTFSDQTGPTQVFTRLMGGGPRTFPGGLNKWQWKRLHERRAREKEKRLLVQEKQVYQARILSEIRAKLSGNPDPGPLNCGPMSAKEHVKVLADRFMKQGAEDLWNEDDGGPAKARGLGGGGLGIGKGRPGSISSPIDLRKIKAEVSYVSFSNGNAKSYFAVRGAGFRFMSGERWKFRGNDSSCSDEDSDYGVVMAMRRSFEGKQGGVGSGNLAESVWEQGKLRGNAFCSSGEEKEERRGRWDGKIGGRAALGKYDVKRTKRVRLRDGEDRLHVAQEVEMIRHQLEQRKLLENEGERMEKREKEESFLSERRFDESGISPSTVKALVDAGYVHMTRVQEASLCVCLGGKDALVKAKAGTGKSAAFLLPAIETVLKETGSNTRPRIRPIYALILCPTRELASQIAAEANVLLKYHNGIGVQTLVGGTRFKEDQKRLQSGPCQIIVATPGRLLDHIENKGGLTVHLMGLKLLVLDEADCLLDLGFRSDIEKIVDCLPRQRQTILFSATIPKEVRRISQVVLKREHAFIDTVGLGSVDTHDKVKQSFLVFSHEFHFQAVYHLLKEHILHTPHYKVILFCTTGNVTSLMYAILRQMKLNVREMHSRKPQLYRDRVSDEFKESKQIILVTSDVSAHGMDYPDVTLVIQVGIPYDREQYIHRLGRTGRQGKDGEGILLLAPWEEYFLDAIKDLPLEKLALPDIDQEITLKVEDSMSRIHPSIKEAAYHAWLGYYNSIREIGRDKTTLVELSNKFCESIGLAKPPPLLRKTALKMGLKNIAGVRIRQ